MPIRVPCILSLQIASIGRKAALFLCIESVTHRANTNHQLIITTPITVSTVYCFYHNNQFIPKQVDPLLRRNLATHPIKSSPPLVPSRTHLIRLYRCPRRALALIVRKSLTAREYGGGSRSRVCFVLFSTLPPSWLSISKAKCILLYLCVYMHCVVVFTYERDSCQFSYFIHMPRFALVEMVVKVVWYFSQDFRFLVFFHSPKEHV